MPCMLLHNSTLHLRGRQLDGPNGCHRTTWPKDCCRSIHASDITQASVTVVASPSAAVPAGKPYSLPMVTKTPPAWQGQAFALLATG